MSALFQSLLFSGTGVPPTTPPTCPPDDPCDCEPCESGGCGSANEDSEDSSMPSGASLNPIRYQNGEIQMAVTDLSSSGYGLTWGHTRVYSNQLQSNGNVTSVDFGNGYNWLTKTTAYLVDVDGDESDIQVVISPRQSFWFTKVGPTFNSVFGALQKLVHDTTNHVYRFIQTDGSVWEFFDFDQTANPAGLLSKIVSPGGKSSLAFSYPNATSLVSKVQRSYAVGGATTTESFSYEYLPSTDANAGLVASVTLRRKVTSGSWTPIEKVEFSYYESSSTNGGLHDLQTAVHQLPNGSGGWNNDKTYYYRYYRNTAGGIGFAHGLKFVLEPEAFRLLSAITNPLTATNTQVAQFADYYFEYDNKQRVKLERVKAGTRDYSFAYTTSISNPIDYNNWQVKTVETLPDGSQNIVYTNHIGQILLKDFVDGGNHWITYNRYDDDLGKLILNAMPSAVEDYDDGQEDLGGPSFILKATDGLVKLTSYYHSTTATSTTPGEARGYKESQKVQQGRTGSLFKLAEYAYFKRTSTNGTTYPLATEKVYPSDTDQTKTQVTSYAYEFFSGKSAIQQKETTFPVVGSAQNGTGVAAVRKEVFDIYGNLTWLMDEREFIFFTGYNIVTGAITQRIEDVDTTLISGEPSGWTTPTDGGLHLITDYEHDDRGRITQSLGPSHSIDLNGVATNVRRATWNVYQDVSFQRWTGEGYATGTSSYTYTLINPVSITKLNANNLVLEQVQATRASTVGKLLPTNTFAQSSYVRWTTHQYTDCCYLSSTRVYHSIPSSGTGTSGTNYDQTDFGYDSMKRPNKQRTPSGTITQTVYDVRGQVTKVYVGTDDTGATSSDPTGGSASGNNMVQIADMIYDGGAAGGDGNRTQSTAYVDDTTTRVTASLYDFRDRRVAVDGEVDFYEELTYDNLDRVIFQDRKDTTASGPLVGRSETRFDTRGRVYQSLRYAVDPISGIVGNHLINDTWYDASGNVLCTLPAGSDAFSKNVYDGIGRTVASYSGYNPTDTIVPDSIASDVIFEQSAMQYDAASNNIFTTLRQRWHNATGVGSLNGPTGTEPKSRDTYQANWSDALGRSIAIANYGTNNSATPPTRPDTVPASTNSVLVSKTRYNNRGEAFETVDAMGKVDRTLWDNAGRTIKTIQNVISGGGTPGSEQNVTVEQGYFAGLLTTVTAKNPVTGDQVTQYEYGVTLSNSFLASNDLLRFEIYPDFVDASDRVTYTYNRQAQQLAKTDQKGSVHTYSYDGLGRRTADSVTLLGSGVDGAVRRISQTYEVRGMVVKITSYNNATGSTIVNEVRNVYNNFGLLIRQFQDHDGAVQTPSTPKVQYAYENGSDNTVRPTSMTYPNDAILKYQYDSTIATKLSRIRSLNWGNADVCQYSYLGINTFVITDYLLPQVTLSYALGSGVTHYNGFDRFGRIDNHIWNNSSGNPLAHLQYGYNRASNRTWRADLVAESLSQNFDELYGYDGVDRLKAFDRGRLNSSHNAISSLVLEQDWQLDATGNWGGFSQNVPADSSRDLTQVRISNTANEITSITNSVGSAWVTPQYDRNGNSTTFPKPSDPTSSFAGIWDAWNRLVEIKDGATTIARYAYDGQNWRITKTSSGTTRHYYYSAGWQIIEERVGAATVPERQFVWGIQYIDDLVLRDRDTDNNGSLNERFYPLQDANWNVVAIADTSGTVQERNSYQAYGSTQVLTPTYTARTTSSFNWETTYGSYRWDAESSLYQVRNRFLNSATGNWISRDPIGFKGSPYNLYELSNGKVLVSVDPFGLMFVQCYGYGPVRHCDITPSCKGGPGDNPGYITLCYPIERSTNPNRILNGDKCKSCDKVTDSEILLCLSLGCPYSPGSHVPGSNCQSNTDERLSKCCLDSTWVPNWYGHHIRTCLEWEYDSFVGEAYCKKWDDSKYTVLPRRPCTREHTERRCWEDRNGIHHCSDYTYCVAWGPGWDPDDPAPPRY